MYEPKTMFASNLEYVVDPANLHFISSNVGGLVAFMDDGFVKIFRLQAYPKGVINLPGIRM